jgi:hypothetical protein
MATKNRSNKTDKMILDTLNKLRSNLADEQKVKQFAYRDMQYTQKPKD